MATTNYRLRAARQARGWSAEDVADGVHRLAIAEGQAPPAIDAHQVCRWERGIRHPRAHSIQLLCKLFGQTPAELGLGPRTPERRSVEETIDEMQRRQFLALAGALGIGSFDAVELLRPTMDAGMLGDLEQLTDTFLGLRETASMAVLQPAVVAHLARLQIQADHLSLTDSVRKRLHAIVARTATLAGRNASTMANRGDAWRYYSLAEQFAPSPGLLADVYACRSILTRSTVLGGSGDLRMAGELIGRAVALAQESEEPAVMAYTLAIRAEQMASVGKSKAFSEGLEAARTLIERHGPFTDAARAPRQLADLDPIEGVGLNMLGRHRQALGVLDGVVTDMEGRGDQSWQATALADRGATWAALGDLDAAARDLDAAVSLSRSIGRLHNVERVSGIVRELPDGAALAPLRESLAAW